MGTTDEIPRLAREYASDLVDATLLLSVDGIGAPLIAAWGRVNGQAPDVLRAMVYDLALAISLMIKAAAKVNESLDPHVMWRTVLDSVPVPDCSP